MITQNPIVGRSRKKLAGVYARTLWGKNIIQSCPKPATAPPSPALRQSRSAFAGIMQMANMVPKPLLYNIYYSAPVGRSRRHVITSQLFTGVSRTNGQVVFRLEDLAELGTNPVATNYGLFYEVLAKDFYIPVAGFHATQVANTGLLPCVFAVSYELRICAPLLSYTALEGNQLHFSNISDTFLGHTVLLLPLWQINMGTVQTPIWQYGSFRLEG